MYIYPRNIPLDRTAILESRFFDDELHTPIYTQTHTYTDSKRKKKEQILVVTRIIENSGVAYDREIFVSREKDETRNLRPFNFPDLNGNEILNVFMDRNTV